MKKNLTLVLLSLLFSAASFAIAPITGIFGSCIGSTTTLTDTLPGGTWSTSNASIASINATSGLVTGVAAGTATITYTVSSGYATASFAVSPSPAAITGIPSTLCPGSTVTLADATSGGTWSSSNYGVATISTSAGVATAVAMGASTIAYTTGTGCAATATLTVSGITITDSIYGAYTICVGSSSTYTIAMSGGTWSSSNPSIATVSSAGVLTGLSAGTTMLSYTVTGSCGTASTYRPVVVSSTTSAGAIYCTTSIVVGGSTTLYNYVSGGTWSSSTASIASINPTTGVVTGVATGTATITYSVTGCGGTSITTTTVTVAAFSGISGHISLTSGSLYGSVKVWLITYNTSTSDLQAADSLLLACSGTSIYYQFATAATDSYRVKAAVIDTSSSTTGYVPTYHTSSYYWYAATVFHHVSGTGDINKDITLGYGATTTGPGFISGNVSAGANKGTTSTVPAVGMLMYVVNTTTSTLIQKTYTDASGNYTFSNLPVGQTYMIYPEAINYATTAYTTINLTTGTPGKTGASFMQHTISKTITPIISKVIDINGAGASITVFPNPTTAVLHIQWNEIASATGTITVTDITGAQLYHSTLDMANGNGTAQVDLSSFANGLYIISIKSGAVNYTGKIQVQH